MSLRIAIISTPRTGNTWLHHLLMEAYGVPGFPIHNPSEVDWAGLPAECCVQLHWHRTPEFEKTLAEGRFRVVTLVRHPLDVLISILQFCLNDSSTLRWLESECGDEQPLYGTMPQSAAFRAYATGPRAIALLGVSREWWPVADGGGLRYEDLVADPVGSMERLTVALGVQPRRPLAEAMERTTMPQMRARLSCDHHAWQGRPGLWKRLLTAPVADEIARVHCSYCEEFGYTCDADPELTPVQADANWVACLGSQVAKKLREHRSQAKLLRHYESQFETLEQANRELHAELTATHASLEASRAACRDVSARLEVMGELGPTTIKLARRMRRWSHHVPGFTTLLKRMVN